MFIIGRFGYCLIFLVELISVFHCREVQADFIMNKNCQNAYAAIFSLQFNKANELIAKEKITNPGNEAVVFLESKRLFLTAFITETQQDLERLKSFKNEALPLLEKGNKQNPYYQLAIAEILMQTAVVKIKFKEFIGAALEIRKAYLILENNKKNFPDFKPNLKGIGILHALIGAVPDNYQWIVHLIGLNGNIKQGTGELYFLLEAIRQDPSLGWLHTETLFLFIFTKHHMLKDYEATSQLINSIDVNDTNPLMKFIIANYYNTTGQSFKTIALLKNYKENSETYGMPYLDFLYGSALLFDLDKRAEDYYKSYLIKFEGLNFVKAANQKLAWIHFINGDTSSYFYFMDKVVKGGYDFIDEDKQALKEAQIREMPNLYLLRSRLLFDGGYYQRALAELAGKKINDFPRLKDQLELTYRMGRIFDKMGNKEKAKFYYETTFKNGEHQTWYFAANAMLNLAVIFEESGDKSNAAVYYRKCLAMRDHEYQNSIDQKAEAGLNRLGIKR